MISLKSIVNRLRKADAPAEAESLKVTPDMIAAAIVTRAENEAKALKDLALVGGLPIDENVLRSVVEEWISYYWALWIDRLNVAFERDNILIPLYFAGMSQTMQATFPQYNRATDESVREEAKQLYFVPKQNVLTEKYLDFCEPEFLANDNVWGLRLIALNARLCKLLNYPRGTPGFVLLFLHIGAGRELDLSLFDRFIPVLSGT